MLTCHNSSAKTQIISTALCFFFFSRLKICCYSNTLVAWVIYVFILTIICCGVIKKKVFFKITLRSLTVKKKKVISYLFIYFAGSYSLLCYRDIWSCYSAIQWSIAISARRLYKSRCITWVCRTCFSATDFTCLLLFPKYIIYNNDSVLTIRWII